MQELKNSRWTCPSCRYPLPKALQNSHLPRRSKLISSCTFLYRFRYSNLIAINFLFPFILPSLHWIRWRNSILLEGPMLISALAYGINATQYSHAFVTKSTMGLQSMYHQHGKRSRHAAL